MKKIVFGIIAAGSVYAYRKVNTTKKALEKLKIEITALNNVSISISRVKLNLDLTFKNQSNLDIGISTFKLLKIKEVKFFNNKNNSFLGAAVVDVSGIKVLANDTSTISNIPVNIPVKNLFNNLSVFKGDIKNNLKIVLVLDSLGKQYELNTENFI